MATKNAYSIRDVKAGIFNPPVLLHTHGEAERSFQNELTSQNSQMAKFPNDFDLYHVGTYDDHNGLFTPVTPPAQLVNGGTLATLAIQQQRNAM